MNPSFSTVLFKRERVWALVHVGGGLIGGIKNIPMTLPFRASCSVCSRISRAVLWSACVKIPEETWHALKCFGHASFIWCQVRKCWLAVYKVVFAITADAHEHVSCCLLNMFLRHVFFAIKRCDGYVSRSFFHLFSLFKGECLKCVHDRFCYPFWICE